MSKNIANEQAILWLYSMTHDPDSFNAINAENCLALIEKQQKQLRGLGAHFCNLKKQRNRILRNLQTDTDWRSDTCDEDSIFKGCNILQSTDKND